MKKIPCEIFSRVVGYFRPLNNWNKGKLEEFKQRKNILLKDNIKVNGDGRNKNR
jgi:hypothetical protein